MNEFVSPNDAELVTDSALKLFESEQAFKLLVAQICKGNIAAYEELYRAYQPKLFNFVKLSLANTCDAEEIVQEVFLKIWLKREEIDLSKNFKSFLFTVAKNEINDHLRLLLHQKKYLDALVLELPNWHNDTERVLNFRETQRIIIELIALLPEKRKRVFEMSRLQGKTYQEISQELQISENTVDTQIRKALVFMKQAWMRVTLSVSLLLNCW
jgi:RNA polymerase sigma-70 factor (ECF subfamily)